jgi:hypothetical protein
MEDIVKKYRSKYGDELDQTISKMFKKMVTDGDGDNLMLFGQHLFQASELVKDQIEKTPAVILEDDDQKKKLH